MADVTADMTNTEETLAMQLGTIRSPTNDDHMLLSQQFMIQRMEDLRQEMMEDFARRSMQRINGHFFCIAIHPIICHVAQIGAPQVA